VFDRTCEKEVWNKVKLHICDYKLLNKLIE